MFHTCPVANAPIIRDHSARLGGSSPWSRAAAHVEHHFSGRLHQLRLAGRGGGRPYLRGAASGRHRGLVRPERAAGRRRLGSVDPQADQDLRPVPPGHLPDTRTIATRDTSASSGSSRSIALTSCRRTRLSCCRWSSTTHVMTMSGCRSGFGKCNGRACRAGSHPRPSSSVYGVCCQGSCRRNRQGPPRRPLACLRSATTRQSVRIRRSKAALLATIAVVVAALGYLVANRLVLSKRSRLAAPVRLRALQPPPSIRHRTRLRCCRS